MSTFRSAEETKQQLRDATRLLLRSTAAHALTTRAIAAQAGLQHSLITRHFGSRDALIREVAAEVLLRFAASIRDADPEDAVRAGFEYVLASPDMMGLASVLVPPETASSDLPAPAADVLEQQLTARHGDGAVDRLDVVVALTLLSGWAATEQRWLGVLGVDAGDDEKVRATRDRVLAHVEQILRPASSTDGDGEPGSAGDD